MTVALLSLLGATLLALVGLVERRQTRFEGLVMDRFDRFDDRFDRSEARVEDRFDALESRFERFEGRMDGLEGRQGRSESRLDRVDERFDRVDDRLDRVVERLDVVAEGQARMEGQIATLDREVGQILDHLPGSEARP